MKGKLITESTWAMMRFSPWLYSISASLRQGWWWMFSDILWHLLYHQSKVTPLAVIMRKQKSHGRKFVSEDNYLKRLDIGSPSIGFSAQALNTSQHRESIWCNALSLREHRKAMVIGSCWGQYIICQKYGEDFNRHDQVWGHRGGVCDWTHIGVTEDDQNNGITQNDQTSHVLVTWLGLLQDSVAAL